MAAGAFFGGFSFGDAVELGFSTRRADGHWECGIGIDDGGGSRVRANCIWNFFADHFVEGPSAGDSRAVSAGRSGGCDRIV